MRPEPTRWKKRIRLMEHDVSRKVLEAVADMSSWGSDLPDGKGRGVAFVESFGVPTAEVVEVTDTGSGIRIDTVWVACDVGTVIDPVNFENLVQGGVIFGLGHAMNCEITYSDGIAEQSNYHAHEGMRLYQCPEIIVRDLRTAEMFAALANPRFRRRRRLLPMPYLQRPASVSAKCVQQTHRFRLRAEP